MFSWFSSTPKTATEPTQKIEDAPLDRRIATTEALQILDQAVGYLWKYEDLLDYMNEAIPESMKDYKTKVTKSIDDLSALIGYIETMKTETPETIVPSQEPELTATILATLSNDQ
uniref:Uncharacterized protein n=1 Tax=Clandestinovirus TaxID=2831644 RepID=A0A8F8PQX8_9VIRU|nr:hypothetical protein KOM_12_280 [Clandestinovirus]